MRARIRQSIVTAILSLALIATTSSASAEPTGTLRIEGSGVQNLVLYDGGGNRINANPVDGRVALPPSTYTLSQVYLTNGPACTSLGALKFEITEATETSLKIGGPLTQKIAVRRSGRTLNMSFHLEDIAQHRYRATVSDAGPPTFTVYKGDKKLADGKFEYG